MAKRFVTTKVEIEGREETKVVELPSREPKPWGDDAELHIVGQRATRIDAVEKVTGTARYTADIQLPGMLHAAILRAPVARGRVTKLDLAPALAIEGVRGGAFMTSTTNHEAWERAVTVLIRQVDEFNASPLMARSDAVESLTGMAKELQVTVKEFRSDPKKFLRMRLF